MRTNSITSNVPGDGLKENTSLVNNQNKSLVTDSSQNVKNDNARSRISSQDSFVVISPKPSKILNPHMISNSSNIPINKDLGAHHISNENQTAFRKPGCFQAIPVTIPGVHTSVRKKEVCENEQKVQYTNVEDCKGENANIKVEDCHNIPEQNAESNLATKVPHSVSETDKQSGFVGDIVNQINSSVKDDKSTVHSDHKPTVINAQQKTVVQNNKNDIRKLETGPNSTKPGFPVKVINQSSNAVHNKDIPPDLPKKEKNMKALQNTSFMPDSNRTISAMHPSQNHVQETKKLPNEKLSKPVPAAKDSAKHSPTSAPDHSKVQNKIAVENSKNSKVDNFGANLVINNPKHNKSEGPKKADTSESNKQCSSDKRFQKVLPPVDKTFSLKPCSARKSLNQNDFPENTGEKVQNKQSSDRTNESVPPSIPPKTSIHTSHHSEKNSNEPPVIPPKKSTIFIKSLQPAQMPKESVSSKENKAIKLPENNPPPIPVHRIEQRTLKNEESISKLNIDIVEVKDVNNEKNAQLQKGNMPDLISKIIPKEKDELILLEESKTEKNIKNEKDDLSNNKNFSTNKENTLENNAPESPKSPRRQSWFFGTHKNSLVVSF